MSKGFFDYQNNFDKIRLVKSIPFADNPERIKRRVTIAIPTFKRPLLLEHALESAINQTNFEDYEIIVVDNDPDINNVPLVIQKYQRDNLYYFKNEANVGLYSNWNRCIELARGDYISILNDDDWLSPNFLSKCQKHMLQGVDGLFFKYNTVYQGGYSERVKTQNSHFPKLKQMLSRHSKRLTLFDFFLGNKSAGSLGVMMKREFLIELGGYNPDYYPSSDYVLHANYCRHYNVFLINETLNYYRVAQNASANQDTLRIWEYLDHDIRHYLIDQIRRYKRLLYFMNTVLTDLQIQGLIDTWGYLTDTDIKPGLKHTLMRKFIGVKYDLNY